MSFEDRFDCIYMLNIYTYIYFIILMYFGLKFMITGTSRSKNLAEMNPVFLCIELQIHRLPVPDHKKGELSALI